MEQILSDIAPYVALGAAVATVILTILIISLLVSVRRLRRAQQAVLGGHGERDLVSHAEGLEDQVRNLRDAVEALESRIEAHKHELDKAFTHRALLRYDAFRETGGEQSASLALLDRDRSGIVISTITSRDEARLYVKELRQGVPDRALSPEEVAAVEKAAPGAAAGGGDRRLPPADDTTP